MPLILATCDADARLICSLTVERHPAFCRNPFPLNTFELIRGDVAERWHEACVIQSPVRFRLSGANLVGGLGLQSDMKRLSLSEAEILS